MGNICLRTSSFFCFQQQINQGRGGEWEEYTGTYLSLGTDNGARNGRCPGVTQFSQLVHTLDIHSRASCPQLPLLTKDVNKSFKNTTPLILKQTLKTEICCFKMFFFLCFVYKDGSGWLNQMETAEGGMKNPIPRFIARWISFSNCPVTMIPVSMTW